MADLKLTNFDVDFVNNDLSFVTGIEAVRQDVEMTLRTFLEETPHDRSVGVPWLQIIFQKGTPTTAVQFIIERTILKVDGVTEVNELETVFGRAGRTITITGFVTALDEEFPIAIVINQDEDS